MKELIRKATRPHIQTALAGMVTAVLAPLMYWEVINLQEAALIQGFLAASALLLSVWYSPHVPVGAGNDFPRWIEGE